MDTANDKIGKLPRVLLVDDEPDILELLEMALLKMGLQVDKASNVRQALAKLAAQHYDLCLTDMRMPDGEGLQIVQHITQHNLDVPSACSRRVRSIIWPSPSHSISCAAWSRPR
jgi:DNA-binding NtrC family response regulator